jgi:hypothetical protein
MDDFLDLMRELRWVRWIVFAVLLYFFWGNWSMVGLIVGICALYEAIDWLTRKPRA